MKLKKLFVLGLTALLVTALATTTTIQANAKSKYIAFEYKYKTDSAYTIKEMKKAKNDTHTSISSDPSYEKSRLKTNKSIYGFTYVKLKKNQTVMLQGTKVSIKNGYFVTSSQSKKINKNLKTTGITFVKGNPVPAVVTVKNGVVYRDGKRLTGSMNHKCVKNKDLIVDFYNGKIIDVQETYF